MHSLENGNQFVWNTKFFESSPKELSSLLIKSLDEIEEKNPGFLVVFSPLGDERLSSASGELLMRVLQRTGV